MLTFGDFFIILGIGILVGILMNRFGRSWVGRQTASLTGVGDVTYSLIGIAGSFIGYHLAAMLQTPSQFVVFLGAALGAVIVIWGWRGR